ncbi:MAG: sigma-70 family RNA polymerase sigma factor [Chitinophagaceae bacterium]|nr:sigma-70 family RNA polymerase sigma factor [Chitinophagaceae bacterium]
MDEALDIPVNMSDERKNNITQTFKTYSRRLLSFIKKRVGDARDAEDILQDVFYQFAENTKPIELLTAWLFTTARNKITDNYRKKKPELLDDIFIEEDESDFSWQEVLFSDNNTPESEYMRSLFRTTLRAALDELPPEQKDIFILHEIEGVPFKLIAEQTGETINTLISRKRYAVLHLRERLSVLRDELINY